jgi:hypothetical protein
MRKKKDGDTLGEKIEKQMTKIAKRKVAQLIDDSFYRVEIEHGHAVQVRRSDFYRSEPQTRLQFGRTFNVPDLV